MATLRTLISMAPVPRPSGVAIQNRPKATVDRTRAQAGKAPSAQHQLSAAQVLPSAQAVQCLLIGWNRIDPRGLAEHPSRVIIPPSAASTRVSAVRS
jgi:hypothetical protein